MLLNLKYIPLLFRFNNLKSDIFNEKHGKDRLTRAFYELSVINCQFIKPNKPMKMSVIKSTSNKRKINENEKPKTDNESLPTKVLKNDKFGEDFYNVECEILAKKLLGKILCRRLNNGIVIKGKIVETECYLGGVDKASYSYNGRRTPANEPMYMKPGTAFVYLTYGMYHCFNISSDGPGAAVLLRAADPLEGMEQMTTHRKTKNKTKVLKTHELCNGPSKLCMSFNINKADCNKIDLANNEHLWIEDGDEVDNSEIVTSSRIGIESAGEEWAKKPLRFYVLGNNSVSKRDKIVEQIISERS